MDLKNSDSIELKLGTKFKVIITKTKMEYDIFDIYDTDAYRPIISLELGELITDNSKYDVIFIKRKNEESINEFILFDSIEEFVIDDDKCGSE